LSSASGQSVVVGIRPEDVMLEPTSQKKAIPITVNLIEPLGSEAIIHALIGDNVFVIKTDTYGDISHLNGITQIYVDTDRVKVFDGETGTALYQPKAV